MASKRFKDADGPDIAANREVAASIAKKQSEMRMAGNAPTDEEVNAFAEKEFLVHFACQPCGLAFMLQQWLVPCRACSSPCFCSCSPLT